MTINLADRFPFPFGRYRDPHGEQSGEVFRDEVLLPAFRASSEPVIVDLDGARGLSPSFLEEAFGGLVRRGVPRKQVLSRLTVKSVRDPSFVETVREYIEEAKEGAAVG